MRTKTRRGNCSNKPLKRECCFMWQTRSLTLPVDCMQSRLVPVASEVRWGGGWKQEHWLNISPRSSETLPSFLSQRLEVYFVQGLQQQPCHDRARWGVTTLETEGWGKPAPEPWGCLPSSHPGLQAHAACRMPEDDSLRDDRHTQLGREAPRSHPL